MSLAYHAIIAVTAAAGVAALAAVGASSSPDAAGWRHLRPGPMHWVGLGLGAGLTLLLAYIWLFVGSSRSDAAQQMAILYWLTLAFGAVTVMVGLSVLRIRRAGVRWRRGELAFATPAGVVTRRLAHVSEIRTTLRGTVLTFADRATLVVDPNAAGAEQLIEAAGRHLERASDD